ncbi:transposase family protein [Escherichia coli]|nr:transposase family protein [Escherichia coli]ELO5003736.1 transposase family protein [Escherichia coli]
MWSWDISYVPSWVKRQHFYLYMIVDIYSRKIIAADIFTKESGQYAAELSQCAVWNEKCSSRNLMHHSDNGGAMCSCALLAKMYAHCVLSSYSVPGSAIIPLIPNDSSGQLSIFHGSQRMVSRP